MIMTNRIEEMTSKAAGVVKSAKAALQGLTGVFRLLEREHGEVSALLMRLKLSSDPDVRRELLPKVRKELLAHERGESSVVYAAFRAQPELSGLAAEHEADAVRLNEAIRDVLLMPVDAAAFPAALARLVELVQEHVEEEESRYFPEAERVLGSRSHELAHEYERAKLEALRELNATP
jgi:hemerythrin superfamily protein